MPKKVANTYQKKRVERVEYKAKKLQPKADRLM